ncbi:MAG TPA: hypothetical protein ENL02_01745 [Epsilonproteobacteria bacterium]|nr:hypothetical protein [Campylobacterota bacterium]
MYKIALACLVVLAMAGCESKQEKEQAKQAELFKQEQIQKAATEAKAVVQKSAEREAAAKVSTQKRAVEEADCRATEKANEPSVMEKMGVSMQDGKITIDTNKTVEFFSIFQKKLDNTTRELDRELREGNLTMTVPVGVEVTSEKVSIDLNKSKSFFDSWGEKMLGFAKEFDKMTQILHEDNHTKEER